MVYRSASRIGATCAITGSILLFVGTYLHPMKADPNEAVAVFTEYAADQLWAKSLDATSGIHFDGGRAFVPCSTAGVGERHGLVTDRGRRSDRQSAVTPALQAVDGIALKAMVDAWAVAPPGQKEIAFHAALSIRQVEIGLASMMSLLFGLTVNVYGAALLVEHTIQSGSADSPSWEACPQ